VHRIVDIVTATTGKGFPPSQSPNPRHHDNSITGEPDMIE
jgi:hypothetical protein